MNATEMGRVLGTLGQLDSFRDNPANGNMAASLVFAALAFWQGPKIYRVLRGMVESAGAIDYGRARNCESAALFLLFGANVVPVAALMFGWYAGRLARKYPKGSADAVPVP